MPSTDNAQRHSHTFDAEMLLKDAGLVAASAALQVGGSAKVVDLGDAFVSGDCVIDITAIESGDGDETYEIMLQFSDVEDFTTSPDTIAQSFHLGNSSNGWSDQYKTGRKVMPFNNRFVDSNGDVKNFRYCRGYVVIGGTITTGINFSMWLAPNKAA